MAIETRATTILRDAEANLRQLAAEAASAGEYSAIIKVAAWAKVIGDLVKSTEPSPSGVTRITSPRAGRQKSGSLKRSSEPRRRVAKAAYPKFLRRGDELIRIAWSKRAKKEYQHKAPFAAVRALASAFAEAGKGGRIFATDELLPICYPADGTEIPNYQAYVCIAWLKQTGLIDQHGRQGYSVPRLDGFQENVEAVWKTLPR